ncbi:hypothetical protein GQ43DRAFT_458172 [Delitschia confertaspora ATCC 74209]|uniref:Initiation-specific alpha-1,6-mannosyltransferase n=1 Tax=Delitschia confertaspora ATCC 74209 TaxID=1513339 RepID=A0A9P4JK29_9PLEO|nr:hypothetical protein GQ43DRAFT_458172 [Delitschia confertaspora ATCC 74209]
MCDPRFSFRECPLLLLLFFDAVALGPVAMISSRRPLGLKSLSSTPGNGQSTISTEIPKKIWYKLGPSGLNDKMRGYTDTCIKNNPNYAFEFMTDEEADAYVEKAFAYHPDIVETYLNLTVPILKADLLRYLLLFHQGGIWSDLDVSCEGVPIDQWVPAEYKNASLVVGWEFDVGWGDQFVRQFTTWTIMAKPGNAHIAKVIDDILDDLYQRTAKERISLAEFKVQDTAEVIDLTGPRRFTGSVLKSLELSLHEKIPLPTISNLMEPKLVGDVLILPGYSFASTSNMYGEMEVGPPLVKHHYAGSWKNEHGGESP